MTHTICGFYVHTASEFISFITGNLATGHIKIRTHIHTTTICVRIIVPNCTTTHIESVANNVHSAATAKSRPLGEGGCERSEQTDEGADKQQLSRNPLP